MSLFDAFAAALGQPSPPAEAAEDPTIDPLAARARRLRALADHPDTPLHEAVAARRALHRLENP